MIPKGLIDELNRWIDGGKYGNVQINFAGGKIVNLNRTESIKVDQLSGTTKIEFIAITNCSVDK